ncbi:MAG TPA: trimethylamine methyltransferase family protein [archaeon]|nr:trimethylamine methyltransferase family protein [archaeon]
MVKRGLRGGQLRFLNRKQIEEVHGATIEVLESVGLRSASERILDVFRRGGAEVEQKDKRIRIPEHLVEESLRKAPRQITLCGRDPGDDILLEDSRVYYGMGGTPTPFIRDVYTGENRRPTKKDFAEATRLGDALPNYSFIMSIAGAYDVPYEVEYEHEWEMLFNNTEKPIVYSAPSAYSARKVLEMAAAVVGGMNELRKRPIMCLYSETICPLSIAAANENIIEFANAGVPITEGPVPMVGATGPGTLTGSLVIANTENLAALTLSQLVNPGTPFIYAGWVGVMDPVAGRMAYGAPEFAMGTGVLNAQMAEFYGLPTFGFAGPSDSKLPDAQAGAEAMQMALVNGLAGVNLCHDCGYLAGGSVGSMEMAVICDDVLGNILRIIKGTEVNDETLAVDVIKEVGPEGNFLGHKHTLKHIRDELHIPSIFDRNPEAAWVKAGSKPIHQVAKEKAQKILKEHSPKPLTRDTQNKLSEIVKQAERERVSRA